MKKSITVILMIMLLFLWSKGADPSNSFGTDNTHSSEKTSKKTQKKNSIPHSSYYLKKAMTYKDKDELQLALFFLKIAASLSPDNMQIVEKIFALKMIIDKKTKKYFKIGEKLYHQNKIEEARKQFLTVLRYDPEHKRALDYLKNKLIPKEYINYTFKKEDSLKSISNKFYKDPDLVCLIIYFNDLKTDAKPKPGEKLKIPVLGQEFNQVIRDRRQHIIKANDLLEKKRFQEVVNITQKILKHDPSNKDAIKLKDEAFHHIGIQFVSQKKYFDAIDAFKKITPEYKDVDDLIQNAIHHELLNAENLLKEKKYEESIHLSKKILDYDESNKAATKLISTTICQQGKDLLLQKKYGEALSVLEKADPAYACVEKTRIFVRNTIEKQAETHYLQGVKYFLNEELQRAIEEWEKTLKLNPKHDKAKKNIKNARILLEKLKKVK